MKLLKLLTLTCMTFVLVITIGWITVFASPESDPADNWQTIRTGIDFRKFRVTDPRPVNLFVARMDRQNPNVTLESSIAKGKLVSGIETVQGMAWRYDQAINFWDQSWGSRNDVAVAINGFYFDRHWNGKFSTRKAASNFYPLLARIPDQKRALQMIKHLLNPKEFWGDYAIPTVACNDPHFEPDTMWRGPVWVNINYIFIEALRQVGEHDLANELLAKTLSLLMSQPGMYEYYHAKSGSPPATAAQAFGWTAAVFIDLAIQASGQRKDQEKGSHE